MLRSLRGHGYYMLHGNLGLHGRSRAVEAEGSGFMFTGRTAVGRQLRRAHIYFIFLCAWEAGSRYGRTPSSRLLAPTKEL